MHFTDACWLFVGASFLGFLLEGLWSVIRHGYWINNTATVWGPFSIIYGVGALAVFLLAYLLRTRSIVLQTVAYAAAGTLVEYLASLFQESCFGTRSWDYSTYPLNIGGRVSIRMSLVWGVLGVLFGCFLFPHLTRLFLAMRSRQNTVICIFLIAFMATNMALTSAALLRWGQRQAGRAAEGSFEIWLDDNFGDERMHRVFHNMSFVS